MCHLLQDFYFQPGPLARKLTLVLLGRCEQMLFVRLARCSSTLQSFISKKIGVGETARRRNSSNCDISQRRDGPVDFATAKLFEKLDVSIEHVCFSLRSPNNETTP